VVNASTTAFELKHGRNSFYEAAVENNLQWTKV